MSDSNEAGAKRLWQSQPTETPSMSTTYLRHRASELERAFKLRTFIEHLSCSLGLLACSIMIFTAPDHWFRASGALLLIGIGWALFQWRRRTRARPSLAAADNGLAFYLRELEHKRDFYKSVWRWYLLPMVPGTVAFLTWAHFHDPGMKAAGAQWICIGLVLAWVVYEQYQAARYQREIDALTASEQARPRD